jgi:hypothetical protein
MEAQGTQSFQAVNQPERFLDLTGANVAGGYRHLQARLPLILVELQQLVEHFLTPRFAACPAPEHVNLLPEMREAPRKMPTRPLSG